MGLSCDKESDCTECKYWYVHNGKSIVVKKEWVCGYDEIGKINNDQIYVTLKSGQKVIALCKCD